MSVLAHRRRGCWLRRSSTTPQRRPLDGISTTPRRQLDNCDHAHSSGRLYPSSRRGLWSCIICAAVQPQRCAASPSPAPKPRRLFAGCLLARCIAPLHTLATPNNPPAWSLRLRQLVYDHTRSADLSDAGRGPVDVLIAAARSLGPSINRLKPSCRISTSHPPPQPRRPSRALRHPLRRSPAPQTTLLLCCPPPPLARRRRFLRGLHSLP
jgi:hypothetical protein